MIPSIKLIPYKKLVGLSLNMSFADNKTAELWRSFMPRRKEIANAISNDLYSLQVYSENFFSQFNPTTEFTKWALVEVTDFNEVPEGMQMFTLPEGQYAVFNYRGSSAKGAEVMGYILQEWLPQSGYQLDNRPHFEVLGEKYKNNSDESEEEIWIPIR
ncbi:GyrI-like domain-containing protein [Flavobacterium alkalisoli]|uniref:GyrI-like domain-containing protein n=1 Tax=Flavobacterium alkalisoli TaxID=2602769 RepID=A0A5B9FXS5_9FLAO|nr:GyrI-like domain-containing protein [Flavobacterium alkalisoli]QEE50558.1 GyrI-like domain-containing protein [Flavobacterium alkalisoli]